MPAPTPATLPKIRKALTFYRVASWVTGIFLLLLVVEMLLKYLGGVEIEAFGPNGFLALVPNDSVTAVNLSTGILIVHGWLYVVYLFSNFNLWSLLRWPFIRFILMALGGVVPFLSFIVEHFMTRIARADIARIEGSATPATIQEVPA